VASLNGDRLRSALELRGRARFLRGLVLDTHVRESGESRTLTMRLRNAPAALRPSMVADVIDSEVRAVMELAPEDTLSADRGFFDLGMGSLMTVALKARLEDRFGMSLPGTLAMDYPSVTALAGYFETLIAGTDPVRTEPVRFRAAESGPESGSTRSPEELSDDEVSDALAAELKALDLEFSEWEFSE
jgi:acyl carrier protein